MLVSPNCMVTVVLLSAVFIVNCDADLRSVSFIAVMCCYFVQCLITVYLASQMLVNFKFCCFHITYTVDFVAMYIV